MFKIFKKLNDDELDVLSYLYENQNSMDTLEGLLHWWLLDRAIKKERYHLREVVRRLVNNGYLIEKNINFSEDVYYCLNKNSLSEINKLIN